MARGGRRGNPYRDASGRFASGPGQGGGLGAARKAARSTSGRKGTLQARTSLKASRAKLRAKDPADQRLSAALSARSQKGAVTKGNRKLSAAKQSAQTRIQPPSRAGTIAKGAGKRNAINKTTVLPPRVPAAQRPGSMTSVLGNTMRALAQADARRIREIESITGQKVRAPRKPPAGAGATVRSPGRRSVSGTLGDNLKKLAQSDARMMREMGNIVRDATPKIGRGKKGALKVVPIGKAINPAKPKSKKLARGPKAKFGKIATPSGAIRKSDFDKIKTDARKGIGTPFSRASQRAIARSAREAPLIRKQAIAVAKRKGRTGFGSGPQMNVGSIKNSAFNWNRNEQPATTRERLAMWQKGERRLRGFWSGGREVDGAYAGYLRASRRAAQLVDYGNHLGNLPTTRKMAEQPRQRRLSRLQANRSNADLSLSTANRTIKPKIDKLQAKIKERQASGKSITEAQKNNLRDLTNQYNKSVRSRQVADAAKSYYDSPWTYKPKRMSGNRVDQSLKAVKPPSRAKGSRTRLPGMTGVVGKPKGLKPGRWRRGGRRRIRQGLQASR